MGGALLETMTSGLWRYRVTNSTDASFPTRIPILSELGPTGIGDAVAQTTFSIFDLSPKQGDPLGTSQLNRVKILPFGTGADDATMKMRLYVWDVVRSRSGGDVLSKRVWVPILLAELLCTLSTQVGLAGGNLIATERLADTIAIESTSANQGVSIDVVSDANNTGAHIIADLKGGQKMELTFDRNASATACNALVGFY